MLQRLRNGDGEDGCLRFISRKCLKVLVFLKNSELNKSMKSTYSITAWGLWGTSPATHHNSPLSPNGLWSTLVPPKHRPLSIRHLNFYPIVWLASGWASNRFSSLLVIPPWAFITLQAHRPNTKPPQQLNPPWRYESDNDGGSIGERPDGRDRVRDKRPKLHSMRRNALQITGRTQKTTNGIGWAVKLIRNAHSCSIVTSLVRYGGSQVG